MIQETALVKEHKRSDRELLEAALAAGPGEKAPDEFVWILAGGHRVGWFTGDGLGARCPDGSVCHVDYRDMRAMLAGHPALDAADAMRDSYDAARYGQGKALEYIQRS